jgi:hypothetical protein
MRGSGPKPFLSQTFRLVLSVHCKIQLPVPQELAFQWDKFRLRPGMK